MNYTSCTTLSYTVHIQDAGTTGDEYNIFPGSGSRPESILADIDNVKERKCAHIYENALIYTDTIGQIAPNEV